MKPPKRQVLKNRKFMTIKTKAFAVIAILYLKLWGATNTIEFISGYKICFRPWKLR